MHLLLADKYDLAMTLTWVIGGAVLLGLLIYCLVVEVPKDREKERLRREKVLEEYERQPKPEYVFKHAKVVAMRKYVYHKTELAMPMLPQQVDEYYVTFLNEDGEEKEYLVPQEFFYTVVQDEEGMLITVNGSFFDFGDGVDVVEGDENVEDLATDEETDEIEEIDEIDETEDGDDLSDGTEE